jgi:hypothetical protein
MTERFRNPVIKYTTDTLKTLPASVLYFYQNGTSTPKAVYADKNKVTSLGATVTADSAGIFVPIFLDGTYRVTLKNAAGTTQTGWPVDNVGGEDTQGAFDDWSAINSYSIGDIVTGSNGLTYLSAANNNLNNDPSVTANIPTYWTILRLTIDWNILIPYLSTDRVFYSNKMYVSLQGSNVGNTPSSNSAWWKQIKEYDVWNSATTYGSGVYVFDGEERFVSVQAANTNHQPSTDTTYTWWKPDWQAIPSLTTVNTVSGGGLLKAYFDNVITDGNSGYLLPLANSVPNKGYIVISKSDVVRTSTPTVTRSGGDTIAYLGGTDTSFIIDTVWADTMILYSNGSNQWSF